MQDILQLQLLNDLATSNTNTYLSLTAIATQDTAGNAVVPVESLSAIQVNTFAADVTPPQLQRFDLDLDAGFLNLTFNEVTDAASFTPTLVSFSDSNNTVAVVSLTGGTTLSRNGLRIDVALATEDLNTLKSNSIVATARWNTYMFFGEGAVTDAAGNNITAFTAAVRVGILVADNRPPVLIEFNVDIGARVITLVFDEFINASIFSPTNLTLINSTLSLPASSFFRLTTSSSVSSAGENNITISIGEDDFHFILNNVYLATSSANTFVLLAGGAVLDLAGNPILPIELPNPFPVTNFNLDIQPPFLREYSLDMNTGILSMTFSEAINKVSLDVSGITIHSTESSEPGRESFTLTIFDQVNSSQPNILEITLATVDVNGIKALTSLAVTQNSTFISLTSSVISDTVNNPLSYIPETRAVRASEYTADSNRPALIQFTFDLDEGRLILKFNETVDISTVQLSQLVLQSTPFTASVHVHLAMTSILGADTASLDILIDKDDLNEIKRLPVCTSLLDCYLSFPETILNDTSGNRVVEVTHNEAVLVANFIPDSTPPQLEAFSVFDFDEGFITLNFSETVNLTSFQVTEIRLQDLPDTPLVQYTLTNGIFSHYNKDTITINFTTLDLNAIKAQDGLCGQSRFQCWIRFSSTLVSDMAGNLITPIVDADLASVDSLLETPSFHVRDTTSPQLVDFDLDLTFGNISLSFDETVDVDSFRPQFITIQDAINATQSYTISSSNNIPVGLRSPSFSFSLLTNDILQLQANIHLATNKENTYLAFTSSMITDTSNNPVVAALGRENPVQVDQYTRDSINPSLTAFLRLDMNLESVQLEFSKPMNDTNINFGGVSIRSAANSLIAYSLSGGENIRFTDTIRREIQFDLLSADVRGIKILYPNLATAANNTYIAIGSGSFIDTAGNPVNEVPTSAAIQASSYGRDTTSPRLQQFELDVDTGIFTLMFDDVINVQSVHPSSISIQNEQVRSGNTAFVTFTNAMSLNSNDLSVMIQLVGTNLDAVKSEPRVGTTVNNTYIVLAPDAFRDVAGSLLVAVLSSDALQANSVSPDFTDPELMSFSFNASSGVLTLLFTEAMNITGINPNGIVLQNAMTNPIRSLQLTGGTPSITNPARIFNFTLSRVNVNYIKQFSDFGTSINNTYLAVESTTISDMNGNKIVAISISNAQRATSHYPDSDLPVLVSYTLDLNTGILVLTFSETVNISTLNPNLFFIQSSPAAASVSEYYQLNDSTTSNSTGAADTVQILLGVMDLNNIKANSLIATSSSTTYLRFLPGAVYDQNGNPTKGVSNGNAVQVAASSAGKY